MSWGLDGVYGCLLFVLWLCHLTPTETSNSPLQKDPGLSMFCLHTSHTRLLLKLFSVKSWLTALASCRHTGEWNLIIHTQHDKRYSRGEDNDCYCQRKSEEGFQIDQNQQSLHVFKRSCNIFFVLAIFMLLSKACDRSVVPNKALDVHSPLHGCCLCRYSLAQWHTSVITGVLRPAVLSASSTKNTCHITLCFKASCLSSFF